LDGAPPLTMGGVPIRAEPWCTAALADVRARALADGFVHLRDVVDRGRVASLRELVHAVARRRRWVTDDGAPLARLGAYDDPSWIEGLAEVFPSSPFRGLGEHVRALAERFAATAVVPHHGDILRVVSPGTPELTTLPHQDAFYIHSETALVTVWVPLAACPLRHGPLAFVAGRRLERLPHRGAGEGRQGIAVEPDTTWSVGDLEEGDALVFDGHTIHGALDNVSSAVRFSADYRFRVV